MKTTATKTVALGTLAVMALASAGPLSAPAQADSKNTWKNLAIAGGVVTGYGLLKHNKTAAIAGGIGTVYAYSRYRKASKKKHSRSQAWYRAHYGRNWRNHYRG